MAYAVVAGTRTHRLLLVILVVTLPSFIILRYTLSSPDESVLRRFSVSWSHWTKCGSLPVGIGSLEEPQWMRLMDGVFVYSAFVTHKHPPQRTVEIMAIVEVANDTFLDHQACVCWFRRSPKDLVMSEVRVESEPWMDRHGTKYGDVRLICDIPENTRTSVVTLECRSRHSCASIRLPVQQMPVESPTPLTFALCSSVLYWAVSVDKLVEFIEYYRIIGIDKFVFYHHEVSGDVQSVLQYYRRKGIVDVYVWNIPGLNMTNTSMDVWYLAQTAALNDCTERTGNLWDYTLIVDLDEFLMINQNKRLPDLVRNGADDCVVIRSAVMRLPPPDLHPTLSLALKYAMRQSYIYPWYWRSKSVCRGRTVLAAGIHYPHWVVPGVRFPAWKRTANPHTVAILFHLREEPLDGEAWWWWWWVRDERGVDYAQRVTVSVDRVLRQLRV